MSTTDLQEHSYLKVLYDFKYKTAEGRQIIIQKDEKLYLLQKTNDDWWQVIRTREQRSFYVPATYVREIRRTAFLGRRKSEEDKDVDLKLPDSPSYENMPKDYVDNTRSVEKWLAGTIECMQGSSKESDNMETYCKLDKSENTNFREMKVGLEQIKSDVEKPEKSIKSDGSGVKDEKKKLELFKSVIKRFSSGTSSLDDARPEKVEKSSKIIKRSSNSSKDTDDKSETSSKAHRCYRVKEKGDGYEENLSVGKRLSTSPKDLEMYSRFESSQQNLFHKELEINLERRNQRKISGNLEYDKLTKDEHGNLEKQSLRKKDNIAEGIMVKTLGKFDNLNVVRTENLSQKHETSSSDRQFDRLDVTSIENVPKVVKGSLDRENNARKISDTLEGTHKTVGSLERSVHNELRSSLERAFIKHCGNSSDKTLVTPDFQTCLKSFNSDKCSLDENQSTKRHASIPPHEYYSSKDALTPNMNLGFNESADRILNDKRKSWAVEELMTELTQMRKERMENKRPNFELESVEIKDSFHPLDKLTQELHEMHASCSDSDTAVPNVQSNVKENDASSINICNISINVAHKEGRTKYNDICETTIDNGTSAEGESCEAVATEMPKSIQYSQVDTEICKSLQTSSENAFVFDKSPNFRPSPLNTSITNSPKIIKSPKSPKILDEYNEANILNDIDNTTTVCSMETFDGASSLSFDKECQLSSYQGHSKVVQLSTDNFEKPCYSNVLLNSEKVKLRPKLKIKAKNIGAEIKLTPSLEKLASEIQFLPANRVSVIDNCNQQNVLSENSILAEAMQQEGNHRLDIDNGSSKSDDVPNISADQEIWKKFKSKLGYKGSFKIKQKEKVSKSKRDSDINKTSADLISQSRKSNLNKFATFHYATSEYYQRCPREKSFMYFGPEVAIREQLKRKSCSLGDLAIDECVDSSTENVDSASIVNKKNQCKPVPSPRAKVSPAKNAVVSINLNTTQYDKGERITANESYNKSASKPIPVQRKLSKDNALHAVDNEFSQSCKEERCQLDVTVPAFSRSYQNLNKDLTNLKIIDVKHSTAVGFKTLLCTSDSGSDEYLQFKTFPKSLQKDSDRDIFKSDSKLNLTIKVNTDGLNAMRRSVSDEQILSSNASSEVLLSQSESEINLTSELSDNPSPINVSDDKEASENFINLPPGWKQKFDENTKQICFVNDRGDKVRT